MATYVNDLRLKEITTGDESGTWGTSTNTNLELIAEAFSYGTEVITTNADTHTTTIDDGATDPGRSLYLKYTGTLDSACTITIGPDTVSKVWIIENGTSGSQNIIISQGSGADITIPAGDTKVVYSDGAGAGAAFFDAFASLSVVDLKVQDDLTVTGDITGTLATAAQPNITSVGTLTGFTSTGIDDNADATALIIDSEENVLLTGAGTGSRYLLLDEVSTYAGSLTIQAGAGSAAFGGGLVMYGHSHASKAGDVVAGISSGSSGSFRVNTTGLDSGSDVFVVQANGFVGIGTTTPTSVSGAAGPVLRIEGANPEIVFADNAGTANQVSNYYLNSLLVWHCPQKTWWGRNSNDFSYNIRKFGYCRCIVKRFRFI
jgi:hypothetical protein